MSKIITLWDIITFIESNGDLAAIRFENKYYAKRLDDQSFGAEIISNIRSANHCSEATAQMIYCTSWGAPQIMGFNLYANIGSPSIADFLASESNQRVAFNKFLTKNGLKLYTPHILTTDVDARKKFAKKYNGAESYATLIAESCKWHGVT